MNVLTNNCCYSRAYFSNSNCHKIYYPHTVVALFCCTYSIVNLLDFLSHSDFLRSHRDIWNFMQKEKQKRKGKKFLLFKSISNNENFFLSKIHILGGILGLSIVIVFFFFWDTYFAHKIARLRFAGSKRPYNIFKLTRQKFHTLNLSFVRF